MSKRVAITVLVAAFGLLPARPSMAQGAPENESARTQARELGKKGQDAFDGKNFAQSEDDFRKADALFHAPTLVLGLARAQAAQGKVVEAWESYHRIVLEGVTTSPAFARALDEAKAEMTAVEARRSKVVLTVTGTDQAHVTLDGAPIKNEALGVERLVDPGPHSVKAAAAGFKDFATDFTVAEGATQSVAIVMTAEASAQGASSPPPSGGSTTTPPPAAAEGTRSKVPALIGFGVGGAGLVLGAVTGGLALGKHSTLKNECPGGVCGPNASSDLSSYHTMGTLSTVGFIVGGVGAVAGAVLLFVGPKSSPKSSAWVMPFVGPGSAGVVGRF